MWLISAARQFLLQVQPPGEQSIQFLGRSLALRFFSAIRRVPVRRGGPAERSGSFPPLPTSLRRTPRREPRTAVDGLFLRGMRPARRDRAPRPLLEISSSSIFSLSRPRCNALGDDFARQLFAKSLGFHQHANQLPLGRLHGGRQQFHLRFHFAAALDRPPGAALRAAPARPRAIPKRFAWPIPNAAAGSEAAARRASENSARQLFLQPSPGPFAARARSGNRDTAAPARAISGRHPRPVRFRNLSGSAAARQRQHAHVKFFFEQQRQASAPWPPGPRCPDRNSRPLAA